MLKEEYWLRTGPQEPGISPRKEDTIKNAVRASLIGCDIAGYKRLEGDNNVTVIQANKNPVTLRFWTPDDAAIAHGIVAEMWKKSNPDRDSLAKMVQASIGQSEIAGYDKKTGASDVAVHLRGGAAPMILLFTSKEDAAIAHGAVAALWQGKNRNMAASMPRAQTP